MGVAGLVIVAPFLIPLLYGNQFLPTVNALYSLSFGILTNGMFQILGLHLAAKKRLGVLTLITASGFGVNLTAKGGGAYQYIYVIAYPFVTGGTWSNFYTTDGKTLSKQFTGTYTVNGAAARHETKGLRSSTDRAGQ